MTNLNKAILLATEQHKNQTYDIYPYMFHINMVLEQSQKLNLNETIQISCVLHDIIEDTGLTFNDIKKAFGEEVAEIVYAVTDELGKNRKERKAKTYPKIRANRDAILVKICDRIANVTHSKKYNPRMYKLYQEEHTDFCKGISPEVTNEKIQVAFIRLTKLM